MSDDNSNFDFCKHDWEPIYDASGNQIGKHCNGTCGTTL